MTDFEQALEGQKTMLATWYVKAVKELTGSAQVDIFRELIEAAR